MRQAERERRVACSTITLGWVTHSHDESAPSSPPSVGSGGRPGAGGDVPVEALVSGAPDQVSNEALEEESGLQRSLTNRHMQMIAIGGAIGTGLFVASGATVSTAGPGGALVAYAAIGLMVLLLMQSLGEMTAHMPVAGSFQTYATRFVSPSFGFAMGWNYWFNWAITVAAELVAAGIVMAYWLPGVPSWIWAALFLALLTTLNALSARAFGEGEFWLSAIKVVTVIVFLIAGVAMIAGIVGGRPAGFGNWTTGDAPFHGGMLAIVSVFMVAGFSFQGTELVGVAAGEARNPRRDVPRAIHTVFWRIMIFYIGAIAVVGFLVPYTDPNLLRSETSDISYSPFTLVFERAGIGIAAAIMNAVILTAVLSAGNSGLYASTRMLHSMALQGHRVQHAGRGVQARVPSAEHGGEDDRVHDGGRDPDPRPLEDQGEGRVGDVGGLRAQQVGVGVGHQEADHRDRPDVEDHDPPEHRVDRPGDVAARVAGLTGRHTHELGALEGEPGHHEHRHDRQHPTVEGGVAGGPVAEARRPAADDAGDHRHARDQEDDDSDHLDGRQPELALPEGSGGQGVERRQQGQEQRRPYP